VTAMEREARHAGMTIPCAAMCMLCVGHACLVAAHVTMQVIERHANTAGPLTWDLPTCARLHRSHSANHVGPIGPGNTSGGARLCQPARCQVQGGERVGQVMVPCCYITRLSALLLQAQVPPHP
jgi:hypothetical protein